MFKNFSITFFLILTLQTYAQHKISGTIYDENNEVVGSSSIKLLSKNLKRQIKTSDDGKYTFDNLTNGEYKLIVVRGKYEETFLLKISDKDSDYNIHLSNPADIKLNQVNIVKLKSVKNELEKQGFAMNVIETAEAATRNIQTNELLDRTVGIKVRQNGGLGARVDYNLNGMSGNSIQVFIDGLPLSTYGSSFNLESIPPALIERIEVYKGVIPGHLSDDAMGGAINVVLKKGARNTLNASISYGSFNTTQSNVFGFYRSKSGFTTKISGFYNYSDNDYKISGEHVYNILPNGRHDYITAKRFNDAYKSYGGRVEVGFSDVKWADQLMLSYNRSNDYNEIQHGQYMTTPYKGRFTESEGNVIGLTYEKKDIFLEGLKINFNLSYGKNHQVVNDTVKYRYDWNGNMVIGLEGEPIFVGAQQGAPTINHIKNEIVTGRSSVSYQISKNHNITLNNYLYVVDRNEQDDMKSALERSFLGTRDLKKSISTIAYDLRGFNNKFKLNTFWKYYQQRTDKMDPKLVIDADGNPTRIEEKSTNNFNTTGYGFASSYQISDGITALLSAERAVRMPNDRELFGDPGDNLLGSFNLKPEVSDNLNIGAKLGPYKMKSHVFSASLSGFVRDTKDKIMRRISTRVNDALEVLPMENLGKSQAIGYEFEFGYKYGRNFNTLFNFSQFNSLYKIKYDQQGNQLQYYNQQIPTEPFFNGNANLQYTFNDLIQQKSRMSLNYNFAYVKAFETVWQTGGVGGSRKNPDQTSHDVGLSYVFPNKKFIVSFDARNIFDERLFDNYAVQKPGRSFYLKLNYTINKF